MLLIPCPYCGMERPELEFRNGGEAHIARPLDPSAVSDADWAEHLYFRSNPKGVMAERWRHVSGCGRFFNVLRDTVSDKFLAVYRQGEQRPPIGAEGRSA
ncbi:MAG TPA: sarcosine oxidase subunit delta [Roseiarcus sp.]|nr:sarcosine oxidase subunit delta [Roseiarcus sp.]